MGKGEEVSIEAKNYKSGRLLQVRLCLEQVLVDFESAVVTEIKNRIGSLDLRWQNVMDRCRYYELSRIDRALSQAMEEIKNLLSSKAGQLQESVAHLQFKLHKQLL